MTLKLSQGYPKTSDFGTKVHLSFHGTFAEVIAAIPGEGDYFIIPDQYPQWADHICTKADTEVKKTAQGSNTHLHLTYMDKAAATPGSSGIVDRQIKCTFSDNGLAKMIEKHPSYKTIWKYDVIHKDSHSISASPAWIESATKVEIPSDDKENWKWIEHGVVPPDGWSVYVQASKPEAAQYIVSAPTVTQRQFFKKESDAEAVAKYVGTHIVPHKTYGRGGGASNWLVLGGVEIYEEDGWYIAQFTCTYADNWDSDIYP